ncbi:helix-turn-helix transcriptional regulator [Micromonospora sp. NPDC049679]|uniref:helix-turn-helix domain-containing protein n=1 Tax=Micromonospora sp. NPDC049679 TaxID=3155920 RepID=UPI0033E77FE7
MEDHARGLGRAIQVRRAELGLKRKEVAQRALLSYPYVSELENGTKTPSPKALRQLADALKLSQAELLARAESSLTIPDNRLALDHVANAAFALPSTATSRPDDPDQDADRRPPSVSATPADDNHLDRLADVVAATVRAELAAWARTTLPALIHDEVRRVLDDRKTQSQ